MGKYKTPPPCPYADSKLTCKWLKLTKKCRFCLTCGTSVRIGNGGTQKEPPPEKEN